MSVRSRTHLCFLAYSLPSVRMREAERGSSSSGNRLIGTKCLANALPSKWVLEEHARLATDRDLARFPLGGLNSGKLPLYVWF